jgi:hypothetical protein
MSPSPIVTAEDVAKARQAVDTAAAELDIAEKDAAAMRGPISGDNATALGLVIARHRQAQGKLDALLQQQRDQAAALAARDARETAAAAELDQVDAELQASLSQLRALTATAEAAVVEAMRFGVVHDALVSRSRVALTRHELLHEQGYDHQTAAGERVGLRLRGTWWRQFDAAGLLTHLIARISRTVLGVSHISSRKAHMAATAHRIDPQLVDGLPDLEPVEQPQRAVARAAHVERETPTDDAPFLVRAARTVTPSSWTGGNR